MVTLLQIFPTSTSKKQTVNQQENLKLWAKPDAGEEKQSLCYSFHLTLLKQCKSFSPVTGTTADYITHRRNRQPFQYTVQEAPSHLFLPPVKFPWEAKRTHFLLGPPNVVQQVNNTRRKAMEFKVKSILAFRDQTRGPRYCVQRTPMSSHKAARIH